MTTKSRYFPPAPEFSSMWVASENPNPESQPVMNTAFYGREIVQPWNFIVTNFLPVLCSASRYFSIQSLPLVNFVGLMSLNFLTLKQNVLSFWWCWRENATSYSRDLLEKQTQILTYNWNLSNIRKVAKTLIYRDSYVTRVLSYERFQSFFQCRHYTYVSSITLWGIETFKKCKKCCWIGALSRPWNPAC